MHVGSTFPGDDHEDSENDRINVSDSGDRLNMEMNGLVPPKGFFEDPNHSHLEEVLTKPDVLEMPENVAWQREANRIVVQQWA